MKVLVATKESQGVRSNDFNFVPEGELVKFSFECDDDGIDGNCGCKRSMSGMVTHKGTTTMKVIDLKITEEQIIKVLTESYKKGGWYKALGKGAKAAILDEVKELLSIAKHFPLNTIIEKRGDDIQARKLPI
jgi:hypothetical protein